MRLIPSPTLILKFFLLLTALTSSALAQEQPAFKCRFRTIGWENTPERLYLLEGDRVVPLEIQNQRLSEPYLYAGSPTLAFYTTKPVLSPDQPLPTPDIRLQLPHNNQDYILLLLPTDPDQSPGFKIMPVQDSATRLPNGSLALVNTTPATLGIRVGNENREIQPMQMQMVPLPENNKPSKRRQTVPFEVFWKSPEGWQRLRSAMLSLPAESNRFMFFHKPVWSVGINTYAQDPIQWTMISR